MTAPLTFVSVVFEAEYPLLTLQARSFSRFLPESLVAGLLVIDNSARGMPDGVRRELLASYGALASRVRILRPEDIDAVPASMGWRSQQVLKLAIADQVPTARYVVLDAKNHLVAPLGEDYLIAPDGRARLRAYSFEAHPLRRDLEQVLRYVGLDPAAHIGRFTATVTPFIFETDRVRAMIADVEHTSGRNFAHEFVREGLTEFFLYAAWIIAQGEDMAQVYDLHEDGSPTVWPRGASPEGVARTLGEAAEGRSPFLTVHRRAFPLFDDASRRLLARFWAERALFPSEEDANGFLVSYARHVDRAARTQRLRELPKKALSIPRKTRNRLRRLTGTRQNPSL